MGNFNSPLVTVGIPFYNAERYLMDAVKSTINQTYGNLEIILLDDGSSDASLKISQEFERKDKRIKVISDGKNIGLPKRLNQLSKLAKGRYYARMDADDIMFPDRIKVQVDYLVKNPEVDLLGTGLVAIDNDNKIIGLRKGGTISHATLKSTLKGVWAAHPTILGKTEWFKENEYDETLRRSQDFELWIRTVEKSQFRRIVEPLLFYREASTSSIKKYMQSTKYSLRTFWKHAYKTGVLFALIQSIKKLGKLFIYLSFFIMGATNALIEKRSLKVSENNKNKFLVFLNQALS
ncbi:glycosyltransferase family 2 protein [Flavobacteriaceae bacterium XHP0103]|uniref:glycosyltransferase family 2 protein n=1 Tax=Marixanthotalea marina TaxID=2844359 RepID=UPI002989CB51|nr:glycosyltransferase family 2 protein [Marixanthotalea marina]MBU3822285.1 glycosyltransferase family 2 protein [Marixanthotalea marina]